VAAERAEGIAAAGLAARDLVDFGKRSTFTANWRRSTNGEINASKAILPVGPAGLDFRRAVNISDAQREVRMRFHGGFYGQLVSGVLWLISGCLAATVGVKAAIIALVFGGFMIFPATEALVRLSGRKKLSAANSLQYLGMQVAFVLPFSMLLLWPVTQYRTNLFYPAMMILLGAHYIPFVFLYGMRLFAFLAGILIAGGVLIAMYGANTFGTGAWSTGAVLVLFAFLGRKYARSDHSLASRSAN
jgi:hypothetical protein